MGMYGNLLDPEAEKMLRGQAMLQFGANLLGAQPTPYPQGTLGTIGQALGATLPMINQQAMDLAVMNQRKQEAEARRAEKEAEIRRQENKPIVAGGVVLDPKTMQPLFDGRQSQSPLQMERLKLDNAKLQWEQKKFQIEQMQNGQLTQYQQAQLENERRRIAIEEEKLARGGERGQIGSVSPGDYTPESVEVFKKSGNFNDLVRYAPSLDVEGQGAVARAKKYGTVMGEAQGTAQANLPKTTWAAGYTRKLVDELLKHPGFSTSVGLQGPSAWAWGGSAVPGSDAAGFQTRLKQLQGKQFLEAFETLKGGGQITEIEGQKATQAIARMETAQNEEEFKLAAQDFIDVVDAAEQRAIQTSSGNFSPQAGPTQTPGAPVQVQSPADVANLPSGTVFITPDGRRKVKP